MLPEKYVSFKKRIFIYALFIVLVGFFSLFFSPYIILKKYAVPIQVTEALYMVRVSNEDVYVNIKYTFYSPEYVENKYFAFPILLPQYSKMVTYTAQYPYINNGQKVVLKKNEIIFEGALPPKNEKLAVYIAYHYTSLNNKILLPLGKVGIFKFKNTITDIQIDIDDKLSTYEANYEMDASYNNFHTILTYHDFLNRNADKFELTW